MSLLGFSNEATDRGDQRLYRVPEGLGTAGRAAEDQRALEDRHDEIGQGHGVLGADAPGSEVADERSPPPGDTLSNSALSSSSWGASSSTIVAMAHPLQ